MAPLTNGPSVRLGLGVAGARPRSTAAGRRRSQPGVWPAARSPRFGPSSNRRPARRSCRYSTCSARHRGGSDTRSPSDRARDTSSTRRPRCPKIAAPTSTPTWRSRISTTPSISARPRIRAGCSPRVWSTRGSAAERTRDDVPFGDQTLRIVMTPRRALGGSLLARLPWLIAGLGTAIALAAALMTERLVRRRAHAEQLALQNARLFSEQRSVAQTLQHCLLPEERPRVPGSRSCRSLCARRRRRRHRWRLVRRDRHRRPPGHDHRRRRLRTWPSSGDRDGVAALCNARVRGARRRAGPDPRQALQVDQCRAGTATSPPSCADWWTLRSTR